MEEGFLTNERLRSAMKARHLTAADVADRMRVDSRTVSRWIDGRLPYPRFRWKLAELVGQEEAVLWPDAERTGAEAAGIEVTRVYPRRVAVPRELWWVMLNAAVREIAILAYAATFLPETYPDLMPLLRGKGAAGCRVRIALGDPTSPRLSERENEERFGDGIISRARVALAHYRPLIGCPGVDVRLHGTTLYNSIFRFDESMLINTHIYGRNAFDAPVLEIHRTVRGGLFDAYAESFEAVWDRATSPNRDLQDDEEL